MLEVSKLTVSVLKPLLLPVVVSLKDLSSLSDAVSIECLSGRVETLDRGSTCVQNLLGWFRETLLLNDVELFVSVNLDRVSLVLLGSSGLSDRAEIGLP